MMSGSSTSGVAMARSFGGTTSHIVARLFTAVNDVFNFARKATVMADMAVMAGGRRTTRSRLDAMLTIAVRVLARISLVGRIS